MSALTPRRAFLRGLVSLPLIGGAVELLGNPRAVAMPVSNQLMFEYMQWLAWEQVKVSEEIHHGWSGNRGYLEEHAAYHVAEHIIGPKVELYDLFKRRPDLRSHANRWQVGAPSASTRAALVLSTVGCDWRGPYL